jgi:DNA-binding NarL/FixJ family response regulator
MNTKLARALIVSPEGPLRDGLLALLTALPRVEIVGVAEDSASALSLIQEHCPALVVLDADLPGDQVWTALRTIKGRWPRIRCVVLASTVERQHAAELAGADSTPLKGYPAEKLYAMIEKLLGDGEAVISE